MIRFFLPAISALLCNWATPTGAQDMWQGQMDNQREAVGSYWSSATSAAIYARRGGSSRSASPRSPAESRERARQTCANGRRMQANANLDPGLDRLAQMCAQAGY